jgi:hypothetical protein
MLDSPCRVVRVAAGRQRRAWGHPCDVTDRLRVAGRGQHLLQASAHVGMPDAVDGLGR